MSFKVTWKLHLECLFISLIISFVLRDLINNVFNGFLEETNIGTIYISLLVLILFLIIISIPITLVHEMIHGVVYKFFGGKVKYGFKGVYAYTQEISGIAIHRTKFLTILLAPLTLISVLSLVIPGNISGIIFILNLLGSTGDILMASYLCRTNENSYILDRSYGFDVKDELQNN